MMFMTMWAWLWLYRCDLPARPEHWWQADVATCELVYRQNGCQRCYDYRGCEIPSPLCKL